jgi:hypothetical protein
VCSSDLSSALFSGSLILSNSTWNSGNKLTSSGPVNFLVAPGSYWLNSTASGYVLKTTPVTVVSGLNNALYIYLSQTKTLLIKEPIPL